MVYHPADLVVEAVVVCVVVAHGDLAVHNDLHVLVGKPFIFIGLVQLDHQVSAAAVDDILGLKPMKVHGSDLIFLDDHQLFRIGLGIFLGLLLIAVAGSDEEKTHLRKVAAAFLSLVLAISN